jgi:ribonuclease HII
VLDFSLENTLSKGRVAGVDEVGYGALAGPVLVCAVVLDPKALPLSFLKEIKDSKQLSPLKREAIYTTFMESPSFGRYAFAEVSVDAMHAKNVLTETLHAMATAVTALQPDGVLVDGVHPIPLPCFMAQRSQPKGDQKSISIALASILAKVTRDRMMVQLAMNYPVFQWERNKGYGTLAHRQAIADHGISPHHRLLYCRHVLTHKACPVKSLSEA